MIGSRALAAGIPLLLLGCASEPLRPDFQAARQLIASATGLDAAPDPEAPPLTPAELDAALADGLGRDEALRLALLNNSRLQAGFMALGVARADYVQSGLLENPTLGLSFLFPAGGGRTRLGGSLAMGVAEAWRLPERRDAAAAVTEQRLLELGQIAGQLVADTDAAYARAVAARELGGTAMQQAALASEARQALETQAEHGAVTVLDVQAAREDALTADLGVREVQARQARAVADLAALLSLPHDLRDVTLLDPLPAAPQGTMDREGLVAHALATRLDLRAAAAAVAAAEARVALETGRAAPDLALGLGYERPESDVDTDHVLGPLLEVELPLFDRNQAQVSRAEYELQQLRHLLEALDAELRQDVRAADGAAALSAGAARLLREELLPAAERGAALAQESFSRGHSTRLPLLEAQRRLARTHALRLEAELRAALDAIALQRALGGPLPEAGP